MTVTLVTALYDIKRDVEGDGRTFDEYLSWFGETLKVKSPMVIFVDESLKDFVENHRKGLPTKVITQSLEEVPYYFLNDRIQEVISDENYKAKVGAPQRVECNMSLYNVIIYSKFPWVKRVIKENPFNSEYFMWMDAGLSRFFDQHGVTAQRPYPSEDAIQTLLDNKDSVLIHASMSYYPDIVNAKVCTEEYFWDARTWIMAGLWGGGSEVLTKFCDMIDETLQEKMLKNGVINNEQNAIAYLYKNNDDMFVVFENYAHLHRQYEIIAELCKMKLALVGPGIMPIPPDGWGAVESLIWDYALELEDLGHEGTIVNTPDWDEIIQYLKEDTYEFAHVHYDVFHPIMDRIAAETDIPKLAISSHYPYIDQPHMHRRDGYDRVFDWIVKNKRYYIFCISKKDYHTFKNAGADESRLLLSENGANHKRFTYRSAAVKPDRSLYLGQIYHRKKQWLYQSIDSIDYVGQNTGATSFDPKINYLGEWTDEYKREHFTDYGSLVLLSDGENGTPLVVKEAMVNGLGVVISKYAAHDLPEGLPFVTVIPDDKLEDIPYVEEKIKENREISIGMRDDIRQFAVDNFSWESLVKLYAQNIEKMESNAN